MTEEAPLSSSDRETLLLIDRAGSGDREARRALIHRLVAVIQARVRRARVRYGIQAAIDERDLIQDVWLTLLEDGGRQLKQWDPRRGSTLEGYVGMVTDREVGNFWQKTATHKRRGRPLGLDDGPELVEPSPSPESTVLDRDTADRLGSHIVSSLPGKGQAVFRYLYTDELSAEEAADVLGVSRQVIYNWRHKIRELAREFMGRIGAT